MTFVLLGLHGNAVMSDTSEAVSKYLEIKQDNIFMFICLCLAVWVCLKKGSENLVLVGLLQIGANNFTVPLTHSSIGQI